MKNHIKQQIKTIQTKLFKNQKHKASEFVTIKPTRNQDMIQFNKLPDTRLNGNCWESETQDEILIDLVSIQGVEINIIPDYKNKLGQMQTNVFINSGKRLIQAYLKKKEVKA